MERLLQLFSQEVLRTDIAGMPLEWIDYRDAVRLYHTGQVAYACGLPLYRVRGGFSALTGLRSHGEHERCSEYAICSDGATRGQRCTKHFVPTSKPLLQLR